MTERRTFNTSERAALFLAADGLCESCGNDLQPGWHADHVQPYSKAGATDVINGQALCPPCNLTKGNKTMDTDNLRKWQRNARDAYLQKLSPNFLISACPGSGKTRLALTLAAEMKRRGFIDQVVVFTPSDSLRMQWSDQVGTGIALRPFEKISDPIRKRGYDGVVSTYSMMLRAGSDAMRRAVNARTFVILDEAHHMSEESAWGAGVINAVEHAGYRLGITGTPWRSDAHSQIPFFNYDEDGTIITDYSYSYGAAAVEGTCRKLAFPLHNGLSEWKRGEELRKAALEVDVVLSREDRSPALVSLLDPSGEWLADVIGAAHKHLTSLRREVPDAGGLVCARDKRHAYQIADLIRVVTGCDAPVVVAPENGGNTGEAQQTIERFRASREPWIVAVRLIAEGVDIPRLAVGVYATTWATPLFFTQVVGRFVRVRSNEKVTATVYIPPTPELWAHVLTIQDELVHSLDEDEPREPREPGEGPASPIYATIGSESTGLDRVHVLGEEFDGGQVDAMQSLLELNDVPQHYAVNILQLQRSGSVATATAVHAPAPVAAPVPLHRQEKALRGQANRLVGKVAHHCYGGKEWAQDVNGDLMRKYKKSRSAMSVDELQRVVDCLTRCLENGQRVR